MCLATVVPRPCVDPWPCARPGRGVFGREGDRWQGSGARVRVGSRGWESGVVGCQSPTRVVDHGHSRLASRAWPVAVAVPGLRFRPGRLARGLPLGVLAGRREVVCPCRHRALSQHPALPRPRRLSLPKPPLRSHSPPRRFPLPAHAPRRRGWLPPVPGASPIRIPHTPARPTRPPRRRACIPMPPP